MSITAKGGGVTERQLEEIFGISRKTIGNGR
jgi:hypothetical protein